MAVDFDVAMADQLTRPATAGGKTHPVGDVVEARLEGHQQIGTLDAGLVRRPLEGVTELTLGQAVGPLDLLLFPELLGVLGHLPAAAFARLRLAMLTRSVGAPIDGALLGETAGALQEQLGPLAATQSTGRSSVS